MKKFKFALDTVLSYKQQVLGVLQGEHAEAVARVRAQEELLEKRFLMVFQNLLSFIKFCYLIKPFIKILLLKSLDLIRH